MSFIVDAWSSNESASAQANASKKAIEEQRRQFDLTRSDQMPWLQAGQGALANMQALNNGDFSKFYQSPDYQFALDEGFKAMDRSAASRGRLYSGGYGQDLTKYGQGLATQNYGNYYNRLAGMAGLGQSTAQNLGSLGQNMANSVSNQYNQIGAARASAYQGYGDALNNGITQIGGWMGGW